MFGAFRRSWLLFLLSVVTILGISSSVTAALDRNTMLYMSFDQEPEGGVVEDESGNENHGTIIGGGVEWTDDGKFGGALEFDGASKIEIPHSDGLNLDRDTTLEIWFRTELPQKGRFLIYKMHDGGGRNYQWGIYLTGDSTNVSMYVVKPNDEVGFVSKAGNFMDGNWHFLAGTYDGETLKCYIDGEIESIAWDGDIRTGEAPVVIGTWNANFFSGALDEARISNVALSEEQIESDYENGYIAVDFAGKLSATWAKIKAQ